MKRIWIVGVILSFLSVAAGFSQVSAPSVAPLSDQALAAILGQSTGTACPTPQGGVALPDQPPGIQFMTCSATATCSNTLPGTPVSCNYGGSGGTCTFQNQNCAAGIRGQVNCNGTITQCPMCPCTPQCCICQEEGDCMSCCRCAGKPISKCIQECGGV